MFRAEEAGCVFHGGSGCSVSVFRHVDGIMLMLFRRGMASFAGRDIAKLKAAKNGKFKYMAEKEMLERAAPFSPYRYVSVITSYTASLVDILSDLSELTM